MICVGPQAKDDFELRMNYAMKLWFLHTPPVSPPVSPPQLRNGGVFQIGWWKTHLQRSRVFKPILDLLWRGLLHQLPPRLQILRQFLHVRRWVLHGDGRVGEAPGRAAAAGGGGIGVDVVRRRGHVEVNVRGGGGGGGGGAAVVGRRLMVSLSEGRAGGIE